MRLRNVPAIFGLLALALTGCASTGFHAKAGHGIQFERSKAEAAENAHRVRAWRSAEAFALGGGY